MSEAPSGRGGRAGALRRDAGPDGPPRTRDAPAALAELRARLAELYDLDRIGSLLAWDQQVLMPPGGADARGEQSATLERIAHERFVSDEIGALLDELRAHEEALAHDDVDACLIRVARRDWEKARRVPPELVGDLARAASRAQHAWLDARTRDDFAAFLPFLRENIRLRREYAACFPEAEHPYDPLLDDYEPGLPTATCRDVLQRLRDGLVPLVARAGARPDAVDDSVLGGPFPVPAQRTLVQEAVALVGYDPHSWRLDEAPHPFQAKIAGDDIRVTTRYAEDSLDSLFSALHECGHGLYEHGVDPALERTPLGSGASMALHESQSRLWENMVGRSPGFWRGFFPRLAATFPGRFDGLGPEDVHRAVNAVRPSLIRVEADEVTYGLHIVVRFELELALFEDRLEAADLPAAWNERMGHYLGVEVPDDRRGVLQDIHWAAGHFGYFPTYALGNVVAGQVWDAVHRDLPDLDERFARADFGALREWLRERLHRLGRRFTPEETLRRVVGSGMDPAPYLAYLDEKVTALYGPAEAA